MEKKLSYQVANLNFEFDLAGETEIGKNQVLLEQDDNLISNTTWHDIGYTIVPFVGDAELESIKTGITQQIAAQIESFGGKVDANFSLENYHKYVDDQIHLKIARITSDGWDTALFPIDFEIINKRLSQIVDTPVTVAMPPHGECLYCLRLVRPNVLSDCNPPHRDVWLDILRNAINIYVPLAGSDENSALPLLPGSHLMPESMLVRSSKGAVVNGKQYTVPCVLSINNEVFNLIRPNPRPNEVLVFSPYLVHGGGTNLNPDTTRVSLEIRFWRKQG
jgi:hypothetical protein